MKEKEMIKKREVEGERKIERNKFTVMTEIYTIATASSSILEWSKSNHGQLSRSSCNWVYQVSSYDRSVIKSMNNSNKNACQ